MSALDRKSIILKKIVDRNEISRTLSVWRFKEQRTVFTNGCFDILHRGHIEYLIKASELGHKLIIGLNTDESVKKLKGKNRPVQDEQARAMILASLSFVDLVVPFYEDTPYEIINLIKPDVLVKGGDYQIENIVGYDVVKSYGGQIVTIDYIEGFSTTSILKKGVGQ